MVSLTILTLTWQGSLSTTMPSCSARLYTFIRYSTPSLSLENDNCNHWLSNVMIKPNIILMIFSKTLENTWKASGIVNLMFSSSWSRSSTRYSRHRSFSFFILNLYFFTPLLWGNSSIAYIKFFYSVKMINLWSSPGNLLRLWIYNNQPIWWHRPDKEINHNDPRCQICPFRKLWGNFGAGLLLLLFSKNLVRKIFLVLEL